MLDGITHPVRYEFRCQDMPEDRFAVTRIQGEEAISQLYRFEIELSSSDHNVDFDDMLSRPCRLGIRVGSEERQIHGIPCQFEMLPAKGKLALYRAVLVPRLWQLSLYRTNEVYLNQSVRDTLEQVLKEGGLSSLDYRLELDRDYEVWPYRCQYQESHLDFLQRLMEREGIYYYFEQGQDNEILVIVDHLSKHQEIPRPQLVYDPVSGLEGQRYGDSLQSLVCRQHRVERDVVLRDYNDESPSVDIKGQALVDAQGVGEVNVFGLNIRNPREGKELAEIWAERIRARRQVFHAESTVGRLSPGHTFRLSRHPRDGFNQSYLVVSVHHSGSDPRALDPRAGAKSPDECYRNSFTAIPAEVQYRSEMRTARPSMQGTLDAVIDAEGDGEYAELDEEGRYKVILPFDRKDREGGKASHWIRMSQAYAGEREGMHFPLRKGAHVLLSFIGGDPDRPVITGAMPNAAHPSVVAAHNQTHGLIRTSTGNRIELENQRDRQRLTLFTPGNQSQLHLGPGRKENSSDGVVALTQGLERKEILGGQHWTVLTLPETRELQGDTSAMPGEGDLVDEQKIFRFRLRDNQGKPQGSDQGYMTQEEELSGNYLINRRVGTYYEYATGNEYKFIGNGISFSYGQAVNVIHGDRDGDPSKLLEHLAGTKLEGLRAYGAKTKEEWDQVRQEKAHIELHQHDVIHRHLGNVYDFGGAWVYNLGNGYVENHMSEAAELNKMFKVTLGDTEYGKEAWTSMGISTGISAGTAVVTSLVTWNPAHLASFYVNAHLKLITTAFSGLTRAANALGEKTNFGDVVDGPDSGEIKTHQGNVVLHTDSAWVEKSIGNSYSFKLGNSIEIEHGDKESHSRGARYEYSYGGKKVEKKWNSLGTLTYHSESDQGTTQEWVYDYSNGGMRSYSRTSSGNSFQVKLMPDTDIKMDISQFSTSLSISFATTSETSISYSPMQSVTKIEGALIDSETKINLPGKVSLKTELDLTTLISEIKAGGFKGSVKRAAAEFKSEQLAEFEQKVLTILKKELLLKKDRSRSKAMSSLCAVAC